MAMPRFITSPLSFIRGRLQSSESELRKNANENIINAENESSRNLGFVPVVLKAIRAQNLYTDDKRKVLVDLFDEQGLMDAILFFEANRINTHDEQSLFYGFYLNKQKKSMIAEFYNTILNPQRSLLEIIRILSHHQADSDFNSYARSKGYIYSTDMADAFATIDKLKIPGFINFLTKTFRKAKYYGEIEAQQNTIYQRLLDSQTNISLFEKIVFINAHAHDGSFMRYIELNGIKHNGIIVKPWYKLRPLFVQYQGSADEFYHIFLKELPDISLEAKMQVLEKIDGSHTLVFDLISALKSDVELAKLFLATPIGYQYLNLLQMADIQAHLLTQKHSDLTNADAELLLVEAAGDAEIAAIIIATPELYQKFTLDDIASLVKNHHEDPKFILMLNAMNYRILKAEGMDINKARELIANPVLASFLNQAAKNHLVSLLIENYQTDFHKNSDEFNTLPLEKQIHLLQALIEFKNTTCSEADRMDTSSPINLIINDTRTTIARVAVDNGDASIMLLSSKAIFIEMAAEQITEQFNLLNINAQERIAHCFNKLLLDANSAVCDKFVTVIKPLLSKEQYQALYPLLPTAILNQIHVDTEGNARSLFAAMDSSFDPSHVSKPVANPSTTKLKTPSVTNNKRPQPKE